MTKRNGSLRRSIDAWMFRHVTRRIAHRASAHGIEVTVLLFGDENEHIMPAKIGDALTLVASYAPRQYRRILHHVRRIHIGLDPTYPAQWVDAIGACLLSRRYLESEHATVADVASTLVHEMTHARLLRCGIGYDEAVRVRVERLCFQAQLEFGTRVPPPDGPRLVDQALAQQARGPEYWSDAAFAERTVQSLQQSGVPRVVARALVFLIGRRAT